MHIVTVRIIARQLLSSMFLKLLILTIVAGNDHTAMRFSGICMVLGSYSYLL